MNKSFYDIFARTSWKEVKEKIYAKSEDDVLRALSKEKRSLEDFAALISPAAEKYLEQIAQESHRLTKKRFGNTIQMYIPMYLSNECQNICTYCGFSLDVKIARKTLSDAEILKEVEVIKSMGYDHVLIVTGEANKTVGVDYFKNAIRLLKPHFAHISMEVQPLDQDEYEALFDEGLNTVLVYQETYNEENYKLHHPKGRKSNFRYRIDTPERLGKAGAHKIGLGALFGLEDWRVDSYFCAMHLDFMEKNYWKSLYSISFPRLRPCAGGIPLKSEITDAQLVQVIGAYRLLSETVELSMSTRESENFRNNVIKLGITSISADSKTDPGGYANPKANLEQFEIDDKRSTKNFIEVIKRQGYEPVFKNWDNSLQTSSNKSHKTEVLSD